MPRSFWSVIVRKEYVVGLFLVLTTISLLAIYGSYPLAMYTATVFTPDVTYDIMLDAGHGGIDSGAVGRDEVFEKDINLEIVLKMKDILEEKGLSVGVTRDSDEDVSHLGEKGTRHRRDLLGRYKLMNSAKLGMSVHVNAAKNTNESGGLVFYMRDSYIDQVYAQIVYEELERVQVMNYHSVIPRSNLLLPKARPPVLLVEIGFLSNDTDLAKLEEPLFRACIAEALASGILKFWNVRELEQTE